MVYPMQRPFNIGPETSQQFSVSGALKIGSGKQNEKRRRIDASVVTMVRNFTKQGHFALTRFMQNFPRLSIAARIDLCCLRRCQMREHSLSDLRTKPKALQTCDNPIPAKDGAEPRDARVGVQTLAGLNDQHSKIRYRTTHPVVESFVRGLNLDPSYF